MVHPISPARGLLSGICIGAADLVPGISGGTVALILGIYDQLIEGLRSFEFSRLLRGDVKGTFAKVPFAFLGSVIGGMGLAIALLVQLIHAILADPVYRPLLYAFFFGLVLASAYMIASRLRTWHPSYFLLGLIGAAAAYMLSGMEKGDIAAVPTHNFFWVFFCGMAGICAMLLPGISGGYLLNVLGMYGPIIAALSGFVKGITVFSIDVDALRLLGTMGLGVLCGALLFSRAISWALRHYHDVTVVILVGFMLGALRSVWPFVDSVTLKAAMPPMEGWLSLGALLLFVIGFCLVHTANKVARNCRGL